MTKNTNKKGLDPAGQIVFGLRLGDYQPAQIIEAFGDSHPWRFFPPPDSKAIEWLMSNGQIRQAKQVEAYNEFVGTQGIERWEHINREMPPVELGLEVLKKWAEGIRKNALRAKGIGELQATIKALREGQEPGRVLDTHKSTMQSITIDTVSDRLVTAEQAGREANDYIDRVTGINDQAAFVPTGMPLFDDILGGLEMGAITGVGGDPGAGKTILTDQMMQHMARNGFRCVYFNEMLERKMVLRAGIRETGLITMRELRAMRKPIDDLSIAIRNAADRQEREKLIIKRQELQRKIADDNRVTLLKRQNDDIRKRPITYRQSIDLDAIEMLSEIRRAATIMGGVDAVFFDHSQLGKVIDGGTDAMVMRRFYMEVRKHVISEFPDAAYVFMQHLNKDMRVIGTGDHKEIKPEASDFAYGGHQEMDVGVILVRNVIHMKQLGITREKVANWKATDPEIWDKFKRTASLHIVKGRDAETGVIHMEADGSFYRLKEKSIDAKGD